MTDHPTPPNDVSQDWNDILENLRRRYPGNRDSTLFCIFKLQQNPGLALRDLRDEAELHGLNLAGRSLHTARVLLGIEPAPSAAPAAAAPAEAGEASARRQRRLERRQSADGSIEDHLIHAVRQLQESAGQQTQRLRTAIQRAIALLQDALEQD